MAAGCTPGYAHLAGTRRPSSLTILAVREELLGSDPKRGLKAFLDVHQDQLRRLEVNSNYIARDMDTWDDYAVLHREVFGVPPPERPDRRQG